MSVTYTGDCDWLCVPEWFRCNKDIEIINFISEDWQPDPNRFTIFIDFNEPDWYLKTKLPQVIERVNDFD